MKFSIGQPIQIKRKVYGGKWRGYIMWYFEEIDEYLVSCDNYSRPSHYSRYPSDELEERTMPKREIKVQQDFRNYMEMLWADRDKLEREHTCKGCKMISVPRDKISWINNVRCSVKGMYLGELELYPYRKSRCLLRCSTVKEANALEKKLKAKGR